MLIYIDGPKNAGVGALAWATQQGFDATHCNVIFSEYPDKNDGLGFIERFNHALGSVDVHIMVRGWVTESLRGSLEGNLGWLSSNYFASEWIYSRPMVDRGGQYVLMPYSEHQCAALKKEQTQYSAFEEIKAYRDYASYWQYDTKYNHYNGRSLVNNSRSTRSSITRVHRWDHEDYVGPKNPEAIFVGESGNLLGMNAPFLNMSSIRYFEPFGVRAIRSFAYTTIEHFDKLPERLQRRGITVGPSAEYYHAELPNVPSVLRDWNEERQLEFIHFVNKRLGEIGK